MMLIFVFVAYVDMTEGKANVKADELLESTVKTNALLSTTELPADKEKYTSFGLTA